MARAIAVESCWGSSGGGIAIQSSKYDDDDDVDDPRNRSGTATPVRIVYVRSPEQKVAFRSSQIGSGKNQKL